MDATNFLLDILPNDRALCDLQLGDYTLCHFRKLIGPSAADVVQGSQTLLFGHHCVHVLRVAAGVDEPHEGELLDLFIRHTQQFEYRFEATTWAINTCVS